MNWRPTTPDIQPSTSSAGAVQRVPVVMTFSGCDPTGGAGIQADIEALASMGCHAAPIITAMTAQDTTSVHRVEPVDPERLLEQARLVLRDVPISGFKIGLLSSAAVVEAVHCVVREWPDVPLVLDPILAAGDGTALIDRQTREMMIRRLFASTTVLTPNSREARLLTSEKHDLDASGAGLVELGCEFVLITGTHEQGDSVVNILYGANERRSTFTWDRLPASYHGSGCTLAAAIAGLLAHGIEPERAIQQAQEYTWESLKHGYRVGGGQLLPNRLYWAHPESRGTQ